MMDRERAEGSLLYFLLYCEEEHQKPTYANYERWHKSKAEHAAYSISARPIRRLLGTWTPAIRQMEVKYPAWRDEHFSPEARRRWEELKAELGIGSRDKAGHPSPD